MMSVLMLILGNTDKQTDECGNTGIRDPIIKFWHDRLLSFYGVSIVFCAVPYRTQNEQEKCRTFGGVCLPLLYILGLEALSTQPKARCAASAKS